MRGVVNAQRIGIQPRFSSRDGFYRVWRDVGSANLGQVAQRFSIHVRIPLRDSGRRECAEHKGDEWEESHWFTAVSAGMSKR